MALILFVYESVLHARDLSCLGRLEWTRQILQIMSGRSATMRCDIDFSSCVDWTHWCDRGYWKYCGWELVSRSAKIHLFLSNIHDSALPNHSIPSKVCENFLVLTFCDRFLAWLPTTLDGITKSSFYLDLCAPDIHCFLQLLLQPYTDITTLAAIRCGGTNNKVWL